MTNEEKATEIAESKYVYDVNKDNCEFYDCYISGIEMAEWKEKEFAQEKQNLIDKACEWLKNNMYEGICEQILSKNTYPFMRDFIEEFRKAISEH